MTNVSVELTFRYAILSSYCEGMTCVPVPSNGAITTTGAKTKRLARNFYSHFVETMADHTTGYSSRFSWRGKQYQVITNKQTNKTNHVLTQLYYMAVSFTDDIKPIFAPTHPGKKNAPKHIPRLGLILWLHC